MTSIPYPPVRPQSTPERPPTTYLSAAALSGTMGVNAAVEALMSDSPTAIDAQAAGLFFFKAAHAHSESAKALQSQLSAAHSQLSAAGQSPAPSITTTALHPGMSSALSAQVDAELADREAWEAAGLWVTNDGLSADQRISQARQSVLDRQPGGRNYNATDGG